MSHWQQTTLKILCLPIILLISSGVGGLPVVGGVGGGSAVVVCESFMQGSTS